MSRPRLCLCLAMLLLAVCRASAEEPVRFTGRVYELDVSSGRDRFVAMLMVAGGNLVAETSSLGALGVLQTALALGLEAEVAYLPGVPNHIVLARVSDAGPARPGRVQELAFDEREARLEARIVVDGAPVVAFTQDPRVQAILQTAMREGRPLEDVQYDTDSRLIDRVVIRILR